MRHRNAILVVALTAVVSLILAACGIEEVAETTTTTQLPPTTAAGTDPTLPEDTTTSQVAATTTTAEPETTGGAVYFLLDELGEEAGGPFLVPVYREATSADAPEMLDLLMAGPSQAEMAGLPTISTAIPNGTRVLGVEIDEGIATVDLSQEYESGGGSFSMFARLAQVVYTLTRIPDIDGVTFAIEHEPVTVFSGEGIELVGPQQRDGYYHLLPAIFVDNPAWGEPVSSPVRVAGLSNVFEATSQVMLTDDDGLALFEETVTATCGTGCWGEWEAAVPYSLGRDQFGSLIVWAHSAEDGSRVDIREYSVFLR